MDFEAEACVKAMKNLGCLKEGSAPWTILQLYSVFGAFPIFSALALATVYLMLLAQHLVNDHAVTSPRLGGVGHEFHSFTRVFESMSKGIGTQVPKWKSNEEQHIWGHCFWMTRPI